MSIPTQTEMSLIVLNIMADGKERSRAQTKANVRQHLNLSEDECNLKTSSGVCVYESRVGWSMSYLARANMLRNVKRGVYVITDFGSSCVKQYSNSKSFMQFLKQTISNNNPWKSSVEDKTNSQSNETTNNEVIENTDESSPQEQIDAAFKQINDELQENLLKHILDKDPEFFERLVVDLLVKMGYGQGRQTQISNDGGIDGIIATTRLVLIQSMYKQKDILQEILWAVQNFKDLLGHLEVFQEAYLLLHRALQRARLNGYRIILMQHLCLLMVSV